MSDVSIIPATATPTAVPAVTVIELENAIEQITNVLNRLGGDRACLLVSYINSLTDSKRKKMVEERLKHLAGELTAKQHDVDIIRACIEKILAMKKEKLQTHLSRSGDSDVMGQKIRQTISDEMDQERLKLSIALEIDSLIHETVVLQAEICMYREIQAKLEKIPIRMLPLALSLE